MFFLKYISIALRFNFIKLSGNKAIFKQNPINFDGVLLENL